MSLYLSDAVLMFLMDKAIEVGSKMRMFLISFVVLGIMPLFPGVHVSMGLVFLIDIASIYIMVKVCQGFKAGYNPSFPA